MRKLIVYFQLVRFHNLILVFAAVILGGWLESGELFSLRLILAALSTLLLAAFGYAFNDYCDLGIDRINKVHRPLPQNKINPVQVLRISVILAAFGIMLSLTVNRYAFALSFLALALLYLYNRRWKKSFLLGNLVVSFLSAGPFIYGGVAVQKVSLSLVPAIFSFLFHFGREILKDLEDHQADQASGAQTLPLRMGRQTALVAVTLVFTVLMLLVFLPYLLNLFNQKYLILAVLGVDWVLLYILWSMWKDSSIENLSRLNSLLKLNMFLGLAAVLAGRL